jgi:hypothetical protein
MARYLSFTFKTSYSPWIVGLYLRPAPWPFLCMGRLGARDDDGKEKVGRGWSRDEKAASPQSPVGSDR